jgi:tryptophanyl-tRNA synthetase
LTQNPSQLEDIVQAGSRKAGEVAKGTLHDATEAMKI